MEIQEETTEIHRFGGPWGALAALGRRPPQNEWRRGIKAWVGAALGRSGGPEGGLLCAHLVPLPSKDFIGVSSRLQVECKSRAIYSLMSLLATSIKISPGDNLPG